MFDTVQLTQSSLKEPDWLRLEKRGGRIRKRRKTGEPYEIILNGKTGSGLPRITVKQLPYKQIWRTMAEAEVGTTLYGSNVYLPAETDVRRFLAIIEDYTGDIIGKQFNARLAGVTRVDCARDFDIGEDQIRGVLSHINAHIRLPRHKWCPVENTIYFRNVGMVNDRTIRLYSKYEQLLARNEHTDHMEAGKGKLRLEVSLRGRKIAAAAKGQNLKVPNAMGILTPEFSDAIIGEILKRIPIHAEPQPEADLYRQAFEILPFERALKAIGWAELRKTFSCDLLDLPNIRISRRTLKGYERDATTVGL